jgi:hypothetical protein
MGRGEPRRNNHLRPLVALGNLIAYDASKNTSQSNILTYWDKEKNFGKIAAALAGRWRVHKLTGY